LLAFVVLGIFYGLIIVDAATTTTTTSVENNGKPISRISFGSCSNQTAPQVRNKQNPFVCLFVCFFLSFFLLCENLAEFQELQENCVCCAMKFHCRVSRVARKLFLGFKSCSLDLSRIYGFKLSK
jgi:hypothetical protein